MKIRNGIFLIILLPIFLDQLSGFLVTEIGLALSLAQVGKIFYIISFFIIVGANPNKFIYTLLFSLILFFPSLSALISGREHISIYGDVVFFSKILLFPLTFFAFQLIFKKAPSFSEHHLHKAFIVLFYTLFIALILSIFGFGLSSYGISEKGISFGYKGYFQAGNELSALFILLYAVNLHIAYRYKKKLTSIIFTCSMGLIISALLVTKTALIGYTLITLTLPFMYKYYGRTNLLRITRQEIQLIKLFLVLLFIGGPFFYIAFEDRISANIERIEYDLNKAKSFNSFIVSGRDIKLQHSLNYYSNYSLSEKIFGTGWTSSVENIRVINNGGGSAEIDVIDLLVALGLLGTLLIYCFWLYILSIILKNFWIGKSHYSIPCLLVFLLLFSNSFIAGHILYSSMVSFYFGIILAMATITTKSAIKPNL